MASKKKAKADEAKEQTTAADNKAETTTDDQGTDTQAAETKAAAEARVAELEAENARLQAQVAAAQTAAGKQAPAAETPTAPGEPFQPDPKSFVIVGSIRGKGKQFKKGQEAPYVEQLATLPGEVARKSFQAHVLGGTIKVKKGE